MRCPFCNEEHPDYAVFCPNTGLPISTSAKKRFSPYLIFGASGLFVLTGIFILFTVLFSQMKEGGISTNFPILDRLFGRASESALEGEVPAGAITQPTIGTELTLSPSTQVTEPPALPTAEQNATAVPESFVTPTNNFPPTEVNLPTSTAASLPATRTDMVYIPGGKFYMGASEDDMKWHLTSCNRHDKCNIIDYEDMTPLHSVELDPYYIDIHEVTNAEYRSCVEAGVCSQPKSEAISQYLSGDYYSNTRYNNYPVVGVGWQDAVTFCNWNDGKRLPTESEWENAAKAGDDWFYPWTRRPDGYTARSIFGDFEPMANFCDVNCPMIRWNETGIDDGWKGPAPVMSFPASPNDLFDMAGNVTEWVQDFYDKGFYSSSPNTNPINLRTNEYHVTRGGGWNNGIYGVSSVQRSAQAPDNPKAFIGFRCVKNAD